MAASGTLISHAQNREDIVLHGLLHETEGPGFYVDIGANHPHEASVTKFFYDRGWRGVNIEPNPAMHKLLVHERPRDINLAIGVASKPGKEKLRLYHSRDKLEGLSTMSSEIKEGYAKETNEDTANYTDITIETRTLADVLNEVQPPVINFMKIDVEGFEYEVLESNDWKKYRPQVLCIESNHIVKDWRPLLKKEGYEKVFFDGLNDYYVAKEYPEIASRFSYPETFLLGPRIVDKKDYDRELQLEKKMQEHRREAGHLHVRVAELEAKLRHKQEELNVQRSLKGQMQILYGTIDNKIMRTLDRRGYGLSSRMPKAKLPVVDSNALSVEELLKVTRAHDAKKYFHYPAVRTSMKLRYRVTAKLYRSSRDGALKGLKKGYRVVKKGRG